MHNRPQSGVSDPVFSERDRADPPRQVVVQLAGSVRACLFIIAAAAVLFGVYFGQGLFMPIAIAMVLSLTLSPIVRSASRRGIPSGITASVLVFGLAIIALVGSLTLTQPVMDWVDDAPRIGSELRNRLESIRGPMEAMNEAGEEVQKLAESNDPSVQEVVVRQPGLLNRAANHIAGFAATILVTFGLTLYMLAYSSLFYEKVVKILPRLSDKKRALRIAYDVERIVSRYLLTVAAINTCLGFAVGTAMWLIGMPSPVLWGIAAGLLNFLPYIGSAVGVLVSAAVAIVTFESLAHAAIAPLVYLGITALEGNFITPAILGRRLELNPVVILLSVSLWGFVWGVVGVLIAVPLLVILKVFCDHVEDLEGLGEFLAGTRRLEEEVDEAEEPEAAA
ncbi:AI-2E family transporter [Microbaculum marinum]|uniref:AI-2E family transporter n=1 Tax=Microbaculum marinum TaxID=1764581 RepID=A0AAW9RA11_9HYPH